MSEQWEQWALKKCPDLIDRKVIEDIKTEIAEYKDDKVIHAERNEMIDIVLQIIDKHIEKENENAAEKS